MTLSQIFVILRARYRVALLVFVLTVGLVLAFTLRLPKQYTASAAVVLDVKSPDPIAGVVLPGMTVSGYMATQVDVLRSERVVLRAIRAMGTDKDPDLQKAWQLSTEGRGDFPSWLAAGVLARLDARPSKDSNVIQVLYTARDPKAAADTANAVVQAYIETTLELRTEPANQFKSLFDESTKTLRESLEVAQARLSDFQRRNGIVATDERFDIETSRLSELSSQLVALQATAAESGDRQAQAVSRSDQMQEVLNNPMITGLSADLARQEAKLNEISQRYGEQHPQLLELRANIRELQNRLNLERARIIGSLTVNNAVNQTRLETLRQSLNAQRSKVLQMKGLRDEAAVLTRDVENARRVYDAGFSRLSQSTLETQTTQTNVSVLKTATAPPFPSSPRQNLNITVGVLLGLVLAIATAVLREVLDSRLRSEADVIGSLSQPLLGVLPVAPTAALSGGRGPLRLMLDRALGKSSVAGGFQS